jgi:hypothetical protein
MEEAMYLTRQGGVTRMRGFIREMDSRMADQIVDDELVGSYVDLAGSPVCRVLDSRAVYQEAKQTLPVQWPAANLLSRKYTKYRIACVLVVEGQRGRGQRRSRG